MEPSIRAWQRSRPLTQIVLLTVLLLGGLFTLLLQARPTDAAADLTVEIIAAYNLVVDSNVESPSTYAPSVATVAGRFCNVGDTPLTNAQGYIGDGTTPGAYPARDSTQAAFIAEHPHLATTGDYSFTHVGGQLGTGDASRFIGVIPPGECRLQYWHFTYPRRANPNNSGVAVWGQTNVPQDDLWLEFQIWGTADGETGPGANNSATQRMTMRNEISAMANKIRPNPDGQWFNTNTSIVSVGDVITSNGILYELGVINQGFDNDGDYVPDFNAWVQPIGDPGYDPSCFRLIRTTGVLTVSRSAGQPDLIIPFDDQDPASAAPYGGPLYFTNLPDDNNGVRGEVFYTFQALNGPCSTGLSPYQEVASGHDNEKFNGDYGTGIPPVASNPPSITLDKNGNAVVPQPGTINYSIPFLNAGSDPAPGLSLSAGAMPLVISDTIPNGLAFSAASATFVGYSGGYTVLYSTNSGDTWSTTAPAVGTISAGPNSLIVVQWWLDDQFPSGASGSALLEVTVPSLYSGSNFVENCADARFGDGAPFAEACTVTVIQGTNALGDFVWRDEDGDGAQDGGPETGISNVTVTLYWDKNGDGLLDSDDVEIGTDVTDGSGIYGFSQLPDGNYIVVVDETDADIPTGYRHTTDTVLAVSLAGGTTNNTLDFGFGPSLAVNKSLIGGGGYEGNELTYVINVSNLRPGGGTPVGPNCQYTVWASLEGTDGFNYNAQSQWTNKNNAFSAGGPDGMYASSAYQNNENIIFGTGFNIQPQPGNIINVETIFSIYYDGTYVNDSAESYLVLNNNVSSYLANQTWVTGDLTPFGPGSAGQGLLVWDVTAAQAWTWTDFAADLDIQLNSVKTGATDGAVLYLDAMGFRITSDAPCVVAEPDDILATVPLTDTYDTSLLQFVSANPAATTVNTGTGLITWDNIGPIDPGQTRSVQVTFLALEPNPEVPTTVNNSTCSTSSLFGDTRLANDDCDTATGIITPTVSLAGTVWSDLGTLGWVGATGYQAGTDLFVPNVTVGLYRCDGLDNPPNLGNNQTCTNQTGGFPDGTWGLVISTTTDASGNYLFEGLPDGYYYVRVDTGSIPGNPTIPSNGADPDNTLSTWRCLDGECTNNDNLWNDPDADLQDMFRLMYAASPDYPLESAGDVTQINFGYALQPALFGTVWHDVDGDGVQDTGDDGLGDGTTFVQVILRNCGPNNICGDGDDSTTSTFTDATGYYEFTNLTAGRTYRIEVQTGTLPAGGTWTQTDDPDATLDSQYTKVNILAGEISGSHDFGYTQSGTAVIGDTLYRDWNGDGDQDAGETGISGVDVTLYLDSNGDGSFDPTQDAVFAAVTTNATGNYSFTVPGTYNYFVVVDEDDLPATFVQTQDPDEAGVCASCDGRSTVGSVTNGSSHLNEDFGYQPTGYGTIGDYVWRDDDHDGIQDAAEPGIANITVSLYVDNNNDGVVDGGDALVAMDSTDTNGNYLFEFLPAGNYLVVVDESDPQLPVGGGNPYILSTNNNPEDVTLAASQNYLDADFGFTTGGIIGDYIWQDNNGDGQPDNFEPGINSVTVQLWRDTDGNGTPDILYATDVTANDPTTGNPGYYEFTGLPADDYVVVVTPPAGFTATGDPDENSPPACVTCDNQSALHLTAGQIDRSRDFGYQPAGVIGDTLWIDSNGNGMRDSGEQGIPAITVELQDGVCTPGSTCPTVETDPDGYYSFGNLADGTYTVVVNTADPDFPAGLTQTFDPDEANPCTTCDSQGTSTIIGGSIDLTRDFGYRFSGNNSVSGTAFHDDNDNAVQDSGETTTYISVTVYLWNCGAGTCGDGDEILVASTTTDANGDYSFTALSDGRYLVSVNANAPSLVGTDPTIVASPTTFRVVDLDVPGADPNPVIAVDQDFGFLSGLDLGDLPDSYRTTMADDGPRHVVIPGLYLGQSVVPDVDANGQSTLVADGDDTDGNDDEDGVVQSSGGGGAYHWGNGMGYVNVDVTGTGCLVGWVDWDGNGTFDVLPTTGGVSELVLLTPVSNLTGQQFTFTSPTSANYGGNFPSELFARFRLFPPNDPRFGNMTVDASGCPLAANGAVALNNLVSGIAQGGEVEDYRFQFFGPTAVSLQHIRATLDSAPFILILAVVITLAFTGLGIALARRRV